MSHAHHPALVQAGPSCMPFLAGGGGTGALIRTHDWAATPLGRSDIWPVPLRTVVGIMLAANQPMFAAWGPERAMLYNDFYAEILGDKHPAALGRPFFEVWHELRDSVGPIMDRAYAGEPTAMDDITLTMFRHGYEEEAHFSFFYAPLRDETGTVSGVYCACAEITAKVFAERRTAFRHALDERLRDLADPDEVMVVAADALGSHLGVARVGYAEVDGGWAAVEREWNRGGLPTLVGRHRLDDYGPTRIAAMRTGRTDVTADFAADPNSAPSVVAIHHGLGIRAQIVVPLVKAGALGALLFVHAYAPRRWHPDEVAAVEDAAERTWATVERARADAALRESEARHRRTLEIGTVGVVYFDMAGGITDANDALLRLIGYTRAELEAGEVRYESLTPPDWAWRDELTIRELLTTGHGGPAEKEYFHRDGSRMSILCASKMLDERTAVEFVIDVTERRRAETALSESEARLRAVIEQAPLAIAFIGPTGDILFRNAMFDRLWGRPAHDTTARTYSDVYEGYHLDGRLVASEEWPGSRAVLNGEVVEGDVFEIVQASGRRFACWLAASPIRDDAGRIAGGVVLFRDVSEERRAQEVLARGREELEARVAERTAERDRVWRNARDLIIIVDTEGRFLEVNPAWSNILGWTVEETIGRPVFDFVHPDDIETTYGALATIAAGPLPVFENRYRHRDGSWRAISWVGAPEADQIYAFGRDVTIERARQTELEAAQEALRQAQKMEAVGQLTGGIAHDFNNMLQGVAGGLDLARRRIEAGRPEEATRYLDAAREASGRAASLTRRLLAFARRQPLDARPVELDALVGGMAELVRRTVGPQVAVDLRMGMGSWPVLCDANQMESALLNLAINARDAMPEGGSLTIATRDLRLTRTDLAGHDDVRPGDFVEVAVTDTGGGMPPEVLARAFEPFFTTKPTGRGTGLGLSQVYGFVRQSGGLMRLGSGVGRGTTVRLFLPRHAGPPMATRPEPSGDAVRRPGGTVAGTVLLVEDEAAVRAHAAEALREAGCEVIEAADGAAALAALRAGASPDALVTDVGLPGVLNGRQVAEAAREMQPGLPVLFITGYAGGVLGDALPDGMSVIGKPFTLDALIDGVRRLLAYRTAPSTGDGERMVGNIAAEEPHDG